MNSLKALLIKTVERKEQVNKMSLLSIKHIFGIRTSLLNGVAYLDEHCYIYASSRHIIFYNIDYKNQTLINYGNEHDILELLAISPDKQYLAIAVNTSDKCRIIIYDINKSLIKKRKILSPKQTIHSAHVLAIVFSNNSKVLLTL